MELVGMDLMVDIISSVLWTGYVENTEKAISLLIIAEPEHGKSQLVSGFRYNRGIIYISDVTTYGLANQIQLYQSRREPINHIIIPDLLNPFSRAKCVVTSFTSFINALTEEGIAKIKTGSLEVGLPMKCGVIACLTTDHWKKYQKKWTDIGFMSRFIPLTYKYSRSMVMSIFDKISGAEPINSQINLNFPQDKVSIKLEPKLHKKLEPYAISIARASGLEGIRLYRDFGILAKGIALRNGRYSVNSDDIDTIIGFTDYINYNFTMLK